MLTQNGGAHAVASPSLPALNDVFFHLQTHDSEWLTQTLRNRWEQLTDKPKHAEALRISAPVCVLDFTLAELPAGLEVSPYIKAFRENAWENTELGPMATWSVELRRAVNKCLSDQRVTAIFLGKRLVTLYNEGYSQLLGDKHPESLGRSIFEIWHDVPDEAFQPFRDCEQYGTPAHISESPYLVNRRGFIEELRMTWSATPLFNEQRDIIGCYVISQDNTFRVNLSRRMTTLLSLAQATSIATGTRDLWERALRSLDPHSTDVPFAAVYMTKQRPKASYHVSLDRATSESSSDPGSFTSQHHIWEFVESAGLRKESKALPSQLNATEAEELFGVDFHAAMSGSQALVVDLSMDSFSSLRSALKPCGIASVLCSRGVVFPVCPGNQETAHAFVLLGLYPCLAFDKDYQQFVQLLQRQCEASLASVLLVEGEVRNLQNEAQRAHSERLLLAVELAEFRQELAEEQMRFKTIADASPVAMVRVSEHGDILYANQNWIDITQHPPSDWERMAWLDTVHPEDRENTVAEWLKLLQGQSCCFQLRLSANYEERETVYIGDDQVTGSTWVIATVYAEKRTDGTVKGAVCCLTDITRQKWIERFHEQRTREAITARQQQEDFMDMISHEARNPLSAIMLCAESILDLLGDLPRPPLLPVLRIEKGIEDAKIILTCAQHQKRIIDDVLTLSKLDAKMLTIEPGEVQLVETISQAVKMFSTEMAKHNIENAISVDPSYGDLHIDWLLLDSNRLLQVLVNLLTNAIKFTKAERKERRIDVTLSASTTRPRSSPRGVEYMDQDQPLTGDDATVFITFEVQDTGCGLRPGEADRIFKRFQQATPRTHVKYGGSGLGLFISRQVTQLLGGSIGVTSDATGSTFAFYVQAARCAPPAGLPRRIVIDESVVGLTVQPATEPMTASETASVLVVEDNIVNQKVLRSQLERLKYKVTVANHGLEALEIIADTRFCKPGGQALDLILLDVEMPVCNGLECVARIRTLQESGAINAHIPIIGVTANARVEQQKAAIQAGMDTVLTKPFRLKDLSSLLDRMLARSNGRDLPAAMPP